jgi:pre-mRNA-splicing factor ISY1
MYLGCCDVLLQVFRTRQQLFKSITPDYYGFRDEEDGVLLAVEAEAEKALQAKVG